MKRFLPLIIVVVVGLAALVGGAVLYQAKLPHLLKIPQDKAIPGKPDTEKMHVRGDPEAPVTIEEFGDFECPPCGSISPFLDQLLNEYKPRLRLIFRNFPLKAHKHAREAAFAAEAAGLAGKFWEMHDVLYREQDAWTKADNPQQLFEDYAGTIGLNVHEFKKDMESEKVQQRVDSDHERGQSLGISKTPSLFLNSAEVARDKLNPEGLHDVINEALKEKSGQKAEQK
jgi:protein-disulfide isomerase